MAMLCGIGFTMSLFIGLLAFDHSDYGVAVRLGVLGGSLLSAVCGFFLLKFVLPKPAPA
jgi:NhaA family Na+:H+ antiporter